MKISLIIPVRDEEHTIDKLLQSVFHQKRKPDEIIITDGGSRDRTRDIIKSYIERGYPIKLIEVKHAYPGKGRNLAIESSTGDIIAFTDAGIRLDPFWLERLIEPVEKDPTVDVVYGNYQPITNTFFKECAALTYIPPMELKKGKMMRHHFIASSLIKRRVWEEVNGFPDLRAAEDRIFMEKVEKAGYNIEFAPQALVYWEIQPDLKSTFKRFSSYSYHDLIAGRAKDWHHAVIKMYLFALFIFILGIFHSLWWLLLLLTSFFLRVVKTIIKRHYELGIKKPFNLLRIVLVSIIIISIDIAMFLGITKWILRFNEVKKNNKI